MRKPLKNGKQTCPACGKEYEPVLKSTCPELSVNQEFPNAKPWEREQLLSGICSDKCWNDVCGGEP